MAFLLKEIPVSGFEYTIGAVPKEGIGRESSVAVLVKMEPYGPVQVGYYVGDGLDLIAFAKDLNWLGRLYGNALLAIECNLHIITIDQLINQYAYPNLYRTKILNGRDAGAGWLTFPYTKPRIEQCAERLIGRMSPINVNVRAEDYANASKIATFCSLEELPSYAN